MSQAQFPVKGPSVYNPGVKNHTKNPFEMTAFQRAGRQATSPERMEEGAAVMALSSPNNHPMINPAVYGMGSMPDVIPRGSGSGGGATSNGSQPTTSQYGGSIDKETTVVVCEGGPGHAASGALANKMDMAPPAAAAVGPSRRPLLPVDPEGNLTRLKARLQEGGADMEAVNVCDEVFRGGVTIEALQRRLTRNECRELHLRDGKQFQRFLEEVAVMGGTKKRCRLCPRDDAIQYKNHRDALRHFLKDHFGLWFGCTDW